MAEAVETMMKNTMRTTALAIVLALLLVPLARASTGIVDLEPFVAGSPQVSADGRIIAACSSNNNHNGNRIGVFDAHTGRMLAVLHVHGDNFALDADGREVAVGDNKDLLLWRWQESTVRRIHVPACTVALSRSWIACTDIIQQPSENSSSVRILDRRTARPLRRIFPQQDILPELRFTEYGLLTINAYGHRKTSVKLWNPASGPLLRKVSTDCSCTGGIVDVRRDRLLIGSQYDYVITARRLPSLTALGDGEPKTKVTSAALSPDGSRVLVSDGCIYDTASGKQVDVWSEDEVHDLTWSPDGHIIAGGAIYDAAHKKLADLQSRLNAVTSAAINPDDSLVAAAHRDGTVKVWNAASGALVSTLSLKPLALTFASNPERLVAATQRQVQTFHGNRSAALPLPGPLQDAAWSANGKVLVRATLRAVQWNRFQAAAQASLLAAGPDRIAFALTPGENSEFQVWSAATGKRGWIYRGPARDGSSKAAGLAFSADGRSLAFAEVYGAGRGPTTASLQMFDAATGRTRWPRPVSLAGPLAFSPDGKWLAVGDGHALVLLDAASAHPVWRHERHGDDILDVRFSPHGDAVVTAGKDGRVVLWDVARGTPRRVFNCPAY